MASIRDAVAAYRPELVLEDPVPIEEVTAFLSEKSSVEAGQVQKVLGALAELAFHSMARARPLPLPGIGSLRPTINLDGSFGAAMDIDADLAALLAEPQAYRAGINRRENIGVSLERMAQMWNSAHPNNPVTDLDAYGAA